MEGEGKPGTGRWRGSVAVGKKLVGVAVERVEETVRGMEEKVIVKAVLWKEGGKQRRLHRRTRRLGPRGNIPGSRYTEDHGRYLSLLMDQEDQEWWSNDRNEK